MAIQVLPQFDPNFLQKRLAIEAAVLNSQQNAEAQAIQNQYAPQRFENEQLNLELQRQLQPLKIQQQVLQNQALQRSLDPVYQQQLRQQDLQDKLAVQNAIQNRSDMTQREMLRRQLLVDAAVGKAVGIVPVAGQEEPGLGFVAAPEALSESQQLGLDQNGVIPYQVGATVPFTEGVGYNAELAQQQIGQQLAKEQAKSDVTLDRMLQIEALRNAGRLENTQAKVEAKKEADAAKPPKPLPRQIAERISDGQSAINELIVLKSYIDDPNLKNISGPVAGRNPLPGGGAFPWSELAANFDGVRNTAKQNIGKYMEGGVLRLEDEKKYEKIIPSKTMMSATQQNQAKVLYNSLRQKLQTDLQNYSRAGYDVSDLELGLEKLDLSFGKKPAPVTENLKVSTGKTFKITPLE